MTDFLVRIFVKNSGETEKMSVRTAYGVLAGMAGIFCNLLLFIVKWLAGFSLQSISVQADAFNNLSDAGSSFVGLAGVKLAGRPADKDHPFGHGRIEYIAALIVAFLILEAGLTCLKESAGKILKPQQMVFHVAAAVVLLLSAGVKLWLAAFNRRLGERIRSRVMLAAAADARGDVMITAAVVASLVFWNITGIYIDGIVGVVVSGIVMWSGVGIARDTLKPLIGEAIDPEIYETITNFVERYEGIEGSHDLIVHNYGPGRSMASIHAEVPNDVDIEVSHEIIDRVEREILEELGVFLVIHMDPVETKDEQVLFVKKQVERVLEAVDRSAGIHDFRLIDGKGRMNLIFDMAVPYEYDDEKQKELKMTLIKLLQIIDERYQCVITMERSYVANAGTREGQ